MKEKTKEKVVFTQHCIAAYSTVQYSSTAEVWCYLGLMGFDSNLAHHHTNMGLKNVRSR